MCPPVGPDALRIRSYSMLVSTFGKTPYPYSPLSLASNSVVPQARMTEPTSIVNDLFFLIEIYRIGAARFFAEAALPF